MRSHEALRAHLALLAKYHEWATRRLLEHIDALPEPDYRRDCGLFFRSVHGTVNHLLVAEHGIWWRRFAEGVSPKLALDAEIEPDRVRARAALIDAAGRWPAFVASVDAARWSGRLDYTSTKGEPRSLPFAATLAHVFNHGTHHRGQISAAITAMGHACPELDLLWVVLAESAQP